MSSPYSPNHDITSGETVDGMTWRWIDGWLPDSQLILFPDVNIPTDYDRLRHEHSLRIVNIFQQLHIPRVALTWANPRSLTGHQSIEDCLPMWMINATLGEAVAERHGFIYGITGKLLASLDFDSLPPDNLMAAWSGEAD